MPNGVAALHVALEPAPEDTPAEATTSKPSAAPVATAVEIGSAVAAAACLLCAGVFELQGGELRRETRNAGGERIARLFELQEATLGEIDFPIVAREQGKIALRQYFDEDFQRRHGPDAGEAVLDEVITELLEILTKVTTFERTWAN